MTQVDEKVEIHYEEILFLVPTLTTATGTRGQRRHENHGVVRCKERLKISKSKMILVQKKFQEKWVLCIHVAHCQK